MSTTATKGTPESAIAAAVAAAAEIARTGGGIFLLGEKQNKSEAKEAKQAMPTVARERCSVANEKNCCNDGVKKSTKLKAGNKETQSSLDAVDELEEYAEKRLARSRERNREHARKTRLRKKAHLQSLQARVKDLEAEGKTLKQKVEECSTASILLGLACGSQHAATDSLISATQPARSPGSPGTDTLPRITLSGGKRKRFVPDDEVDRPVQQPISVVIDGQTTVVGGGRGHINWKTGVYTDENNNHRQFTQEQLESLRRERNRMHAKMTRDRKKCFISTIERTIEKLETENERMRGALLQVAQMTGCVSPDPSSHATPEIVPEDATTSSQGGLRERVPSDLSLSVA